MKLTMHFKLVVYIFSLLITFVSFSGAEETSNSTNTAISIASNPVVHRGDTKEQLDKILGASKGWKAGNEETAYYMRGHVLFRDGLAVKWMILSDEEMAAKKQREAQNGDIDYDFSMKQSIPQSSPEELAFRRRLAQKQYNEQRQEEEQGLLSAEKRRGIATYQKQGLGRREYEEDAAFVRNLLAESKIPSKRDNDDVLVSQIERQSYVDEGTLADHSELQSNVAVEPAVPNVGVSMVPGSGGGMIVGGSMNGTLMPGSQGGMVIGGPLNGTLMPGSQGGMVVGGPMNGTLLPGGQGGMVIGGPLNGTLMPGSQGGMVIGGPLNGSLMPGSKGGMVIGGPLNGSLMPGQ